MLNSLEQRIEILKEKGYNLPLNSILEDSFTHWKKIIFYGIFTILFGYLFNSVAGLYIGNMLGTNSLDIEFQNALMELSKSPEGIQKIIPLSQEYINNPLVLKKILLSSLTEILLYPLGAGLVYCAYKNDTVGVATFKDLISGFQGSKFLNLIGLTLIVTILTLLSTFLLLVPVLYFIPAFILAGAFIIIDDVPLVKAIKYSMQIVNMKFMQVLSIVIVSFFISKILGLFMCGIGLILTLPFSFAVVYSLYKNTIGTVKALPENESNPDVY